MRKFAFRSAIRFAVVVAVIAAGVVAYQYGSAIGGYLSQLNMDAEQEASAAYAKRIQVRGYQLIGRRKEARHGPRDYLYLGPTHENSLEVISGPRLVMKPPRPEQVPFGFVEPVGYGEVTEPVNGMLCGVYVDRVKRGIDLPDLYGLSALQESAVRGGEMTILEITVLCHKS